MFITYDETKCKTLLRDYFSAADALVDGLKSGRFSAYQFERYREAKRAVQESGFLEPKL